MTLFSYLLMGHLVGDYLLQTNWMASRKETQWLPLFLHCIVYTSVVALAFLISTQTMVFEVIALLFISHVIIDRRHFIAWWTETIMGVKNGQPAWLYVMTDQIFHLLILAVIAHFWGSAGL